MLFTEYIVQPNTRATEQEGVHTAAQSYTKALWAAQSYTKALWASPLGSIDSRGVTTAHAPPPVRCSLPQAQPGDHTRRCAAAESVLCSAGCSTVSSSIKPLVPAPRKLHATSCAVLCGAHIRARPGLCARGGERPGTAAQQHTARQQGSTARSAAVATWSLRPTAPGSPSTPLRSRLPGN